MVSLHGLPTRLKTLARNKSSFRGNNAGEDKSTPILILKVKVVRARDLAAKDRRGKSDPYVILVSRHAIAIDTMRLTHTSASTTKRPRQRSYPLT